MALVTALATTLSLFTATPLLSGCRSETEITEYQAHSLVNKALNLEDKKERLESVKKLEYDDEKLMTIVIQSSPENEEVWRMAVRLIGAQPEVLNKLVEKLSSESHEETKDKDNALNKTIYVANRLALMIDHIDDNYSLATTITYSDNERAISVATEKLRGELEKDIGILISILDLAPQEYNKINAASFLAIIYADKLNGDDIPKERKLKALENIATYCADETYAMWAVEKINDMKTKDPSSETIWESLRNIAAISEHKKVRDWAMEKFGDLYSLSTIAVGRFTQDIKRTGKPYDLCGRETAQDAMEKLSEKVDELIKIVDEYIAQSKKIDVEDYENQENNKIIFETGLAFVICSKNTNHRQTALRALEERVDNLDSNIAQSILASSTDDREVIKKVIQKFIYDDRNPGVINYILHAAKCELGRILVANNYSFMIDDKEFGKPEMLRIIANWSEDADSRKIAVDRLDDPEVLARIIEESEYDNTKAYAKQRLEIEKDAKKLENVKTTDDLVAGINAAIKKLLDK